MSSEIRIVIADGHKLFREALISLFSEIDSNVKVIGEAYNGIELIRVLGKKEPHIVLLDLGQPIMGGDATFKRIRKEFPKVKVIVLNSFLGDRIVAYYMSNGALACLSKECNSETLLDAIYSAWASKPYFDPSTSTAVLKGLINEQTANLIYGKLSLKTREIEVIREICKGSTSREIAEVLNIVTATVNFHRANIYKKTGTHNLVSLILYAVRTGIISIYDKDIEPKNEQVLEETTS